MATKLAGKFGKLATFTKGTEIVATTALAAGYYVCTAVATSASGLPDGISAGYPFYASDASGKTVTPASGDKEKLLTPTDRCDVNAFTLDFQVDEIDVTTLCDDTKEFIPGFSEMTGTMEGVTTLDISEDLINKFLPTVTQTADLQTVTVSEINGDPIYGMFEINKESRNNEAIAMYIVPITITSYNAGAQISDKQAFTANFRITPDADINPCFLKVLQS